MKRTLWAALGVALVALAVPALALAHHRNSRHHGHPSFRHHRGWDGPPGAAATVSTYANGVLTLSLASGGTLTANVSEHTHFVCLRRHDYSRHRSTHGRLASFRHSDVGSTGSTGWTGSTGSTGPTGPSGPTAPTGTTGTTGSGGYYGGHGHDHGSGGFGRGDGGYGNSHSPTYTPPPPCDSSLLVPGAPLQSAGVLVVPGGVQFRIIVLLPAVQ